MKEQRWPGDYESMSEEFRNSKSQEQMGMNAANASHGNDYLSYEKGYRMDDYQIGELEDSWCQQLDKVGMQPHSREYLERVATCERSARKFECISGQMIDYPDGIQFSGRP